MKLITLEKNLEIAKKLALAIGLEENGIEVHISGAEIQCSGGKYFRVFVSNRANVKNKILHIDVRDFVTSKTAKLMKYKKPPFITLGSHKQSPSKETLFNKSLEMNTVLTYEQYDEIEKIVDAYGNAIFINIFVEAYDK